METSSGVPAKNTHMAPIEGPGNRPSDAPPDSLVGTSAGGSQPSTTTDPGLAGQMAGAGTGTSGGLDDSGGVDSSGTTRMGSGSPGASDEALGAERRPRPTETSGAGGVPDAARLGSTLAATPGSSGSGSGAGQEPDLTSDVGGI
jgi:hypothetical protein